MPSRGIDGDSRAVRSAPASARVIRLTRSVTRSSKLTDVLQNFHWCEATWEHAGPGGNGFDPLPHVAEGGGNGAHSTKNVAIAPGAPQGPSPGGAPAHGAVHVPFGMAGAAPFRVQPQ
jgi:hypothetical protein